VVSAADAQRAAALLAAEGETVYTIGRIESRQAEQAQTIVI
jgi:phosphoribosylaminoimidazole (AIR) synthetase